MFPFLCVAVIENCSIVVEFKGTADWKVKGRQPAFPSSAWPYNCKVTYARVKKACIISKERRE